MSQWNHTSCMDQSRHTHIHTCTLTHAHTYTHTHAHVYTYTCTHTYKYNIMMLWFDFVGQHVQYDVPIIYYVICIKDFQHKHIMMLQYYTPHTPHGDVHSDP